jgi:purine-cytosine permease-like protein
MRLKLVLLAALVAAIAGSGASIALIITFSSSLRAIARPGLLVLSTFLLPAVAVLLAAIFVYRHTARRRKLQAILTTIIATLLTLALFIAASIISSRTQQIRPPAPAGPQVIG